MKATPDGLRRMISEAVAGAVERELPRLLRTALRSVLKEELDRAAARLDEASEEPSRPKITRVDPAAIERERQQARAAVRNKLTDPGQNPMAFLFEGVQPVSDEAVTVTTSDVPVERLFGGDMPDYSKHVGERSGPRAAAGASQEEAEARLRRLRASLEVPV